MSTRLCTSGCGTHLSRFNSDDVCATCEERVTQERIARGARVGHVGHQHLTKSELRVFQLVAVGHTNEEIAGALDLSQEGVKSHIRNILRKLGVSSRGRAVWRALELGIIEPPETS